LLIGKRLQQIIFSRQNGVEPFIADELHSPSAVLAYMTQNTNGIAGGHMKL